MSAIYSGAFWNSAQLPESNAVLRHRSRNDTSCNRCHLVPSRVRIESLSRPRSISTPSKGLEWSRPSRARQERFQSILRERGVTATLRREKGHDIAAACGQLRLQTVELNAQSGFHSNSVGP